MLIQTPKTPKFLQKMQWVMNPVKYLESNAKGYPDAFEGSIVGYGGSLIFINHPEAIKEVFVSNRDKLASPAEFNAFLKPIVGAHSLITMKEERHQKHRKLLAPAFHGASMLHCGESIIKSTRTVIDNLPLNEPFLAQEAMQDVALKVILEVIFGSEGGELYQTIKSFLQTLGNLINSPLSSSLIFFSFLQKDLGPQSTWGKFLRQKQTLEELLYCEIERRRSQKDSNRTDILSLLIAVQDEDGNFLSNEALRDELIGLILAGYENTATSLAWELYWTHKLPAVKAKLQAELETCGNTPDPLTLFRLPYLTAVCHETLRIYPMIILTFPRLVKDPIELGNGDRLEKNKVVVVGIYPLHHRADLYPDSKQFKPERFIERQFLPHEFMPFGIGLRSCIGDAFAMFTMKLTLATILTNYELSLVSQEPEKPQRRGLSIAPATGIPMMLTRK